ncbi:MAG: APC family permease [Saprospiraceae bacterium]
MSKTVSGKKKNLGLLELIAIAIGGMVGGGIFTILGISVSLIGNLTPIAIIVGGLIAVLAAYSYVKLGLYYKDEGATYSFYKKTYPTSPFSASGIGWLVIFGYISTLALYAFTFSSYAISASEFANNILIRKLISILVIAFFTFINVWSVKGMGKLEDIMVYSKLVALAAISFFLIFYGDGNFVGFTEKLFADAEKASVLNILIVASVTFVAYEGFQLVINAVNEMSNPEKNIPRAIYSSIVIVIFIYVIISIGALFAIPIEDIIRNKEYALASGAGKVMGKIGNNLVILGAILATSSAISGTLFGSSRQMSIIASDGNFPQFLEKRNKNIPRNAIITMATIASILVLIGGLQLILEFGSITFLLVSLLMAIANFKIRKQTNSSSVVTIISILGLSMGGVLILYYEFNNNWEQMVSILVLYIILTASAWFYSRRKTINS